MQIGIGISPTIPGQNTFGKGATLALDFTRNSFSSATQTVSDPSLLTGWTFTRASTKTALNSSGAVVSFASGVPAITDLGFLPEAAATNLALWSQDISNAAWTKTDITVGASIAAPDGTITAALATAGSAGTDTLAGNSATIVASSTNTISIHLKKSGSQWLRLVFADATGTDGFNQWVDLTNGALGTSTLRGSGTRTGATIQALINGWYRVTLTGVASTRTSLGLSVVSASGDGSTTRVNGATYYPWGYQVEAGSAASSYIATTTAAVTRAADVASISGLSAQAAATWFAEFQPNVLGASSRLVGGTATPNFSTPINLATGAAQVYDAGIVATTANTVAAGAIGRAAMSYSAAGTSVVLNGGAVATGAAPPNLGSLTTFVIGGDLTGSVGPEFGGYVRRVYQRSGAITGAQLQGLTQ